ncbi:hypothetical protein LCGC14_0349830 [marine sediment metagenome]|uniref:Uncharacterized protein n=1 Tax=marine sediment metagenome TaxID=412755 RepID=A0A0F9VYF8_9ZZZZ
MANETFRSVEDVYTKHPWMRDIPGGPAIARKAVGAISNTGAVHAVWKFYQDQGGGKGFNAFRKAPDIPPGATALTPRATDILARTGGVPAGVTTAPPPDPSQIPVADRIGALGIQRDIDEPTPDDGDGDLLPLQFRTFEEASAAAPEGWVVDRDEFGFFTIKRVPTRQRAAGNIYKTFKEADAAAPEGFRAVQVGDGWGLERIDPTREPGFVSEFEQQQLDFMQQQSQQNAENQRLQHIAGLAARGPVSWLELASFTGQDPGVQPWMEQLGLAGGDDLTAGQPLPGFGGQGASFENLPQLTNPSAQFLSRQGPDVQAQFAGFRQARTGATPQQTAFQQRIGAAPGGRNPGLRFLR